LSWFASSALCNAWLERLNDLLTGVGLMDLLSTASRMYFDNTSEFRLELRSADVCNGLGDSLLTHFIGESMHHAVSHLMDDLQWITRDLVRLDARVLADRSVYQSPEDLFSALRGAVNSHTAHAAT